MQITKDFEDVTTEFDTQDASDNKIMALLSYISWLVLVPLIGSKSPFARFHANQGLVLAIAEIIWNVVLGIVSSILYAVLGLIHLTFIATILVSVLRLVNLAFLIFSIIGIVDAISGRARKFPIIGGFSLIK